MALRREDREGNGIELECAERSAVIGATAWVTVDRLDQFRDAGLAIADDVRRFDAGHGNHPAVDHKDAVFRARCEALYQDRGTLLPSHLVSGPNLLLRPQVEADANRQVAIVDDPASDGRFFPRIGESLQFATKNLLAVPMLVKDRAIGVVEVLNKQNDTRFTERDAELATAFASLAAIAIDNAHLYAQLADDVPHRFAPRLD